jgi:hypothetical protein
MKITSSRWLVQTCVGLILGMVGGGILLLTAIPALATWAGDNCNGTGNQVNVWKRSQAKNYVQLANHEGYEWGGGCYRLNNRDDTPNAPDSGGEGNDCSGFTFRAWALKVDGSAGYKFWEMEKDIHGPSSTGSYYDPQPDWQFRNINKSYFATEYMDAFAYRSGDEGHIGLIYNEGNGGSDYIIHAKSDAEGTTITYEDYRSSSAFRGVARKGWTPECFPRCP